MKKPKVMMQVEPEDREVIRTVCKKRGRSMAKQTVILYREEAVRIEREERFGLLGDKK